MRSTMNLVVFSILVLLVIASTNTHMAEAGGARVAHFYGKPRFNPAAWSQEAVSNGDADGAGNEDSFVANAKKSLRPSLRLGKRGDEGNGE